MGDINIDDNKPSSEKRQFDELLMSFGISRISLPPTRVTSTTSSSIDAVCSNLQDIVVENIVTGVSDHCGQLCSLNVSAQKMKSLTSVRRHLNRNNLAALKYHLSQEPWDSVVRCNTVEEAFSSFGSIISVALDVCCPLKRSRENRSIKKMYVYDKDVRNLKLRFLEAVELFKQTGNQEDKDKSVELKKLYDKKLKELRRKANGDFINNADNTSKAIWVTINQERKNKRSVESGMKVLKVEEFIIEDPTTMASKFNSYFSTIAEKSLIKSQTASGNVRATTPPNDFVEPFGLLPMTEIAPTSEEELLKVVQSLKSKTSAGIDEVSSRMLKFCCEELICPLNYIANLSFQEGIFPARLKVSKVIPLAKKGKLADIENYRPISLVSTFSKVLEKIVLARLFHHLNACKLLTESQHGFLRGRSTLTALVDLVERIYDCLEEGKHAIGIFLDLSKAFDSLSHELILTKLSRLGIEGSALSWLKSYLSGRHQLVEIRQVVNGQVKSGTSGLLPVLRGVPQGSVLGPVLFILFLNDFPAFIHPFSEPVTYADDTVLLTSNRSVEALEIDSFVSVNLASDYCTKNSLIFNEAKTNQMNFGNKKDDISDLPLLSAKDSTKHLGLMIDNRLSWCDHVDYLCSKLSCGLFAIRRTLAVSTMEATVTAYHALFESHLRHGIAVWGATSQGNLNRVLLIQKRALRVMARVQWRVSCRGIFVEWGLLTVVSLYILEVVVLASSRRLPRNENSHQYSTRHGRDYQLPVHRLSQFEQKPSYAGMKFFNMLPEEMKEMGPKKLKVTLLRWLGSRPFYSVQEFLNWRNFSYQ